MNSNELEVMLISSEHHYHCRCNTCLQWWKMLGPDPESGKYGPFTNAEVIAGRTNDPEPILPGESMLRE